jgi:hypothetical protein
MDVLAKNTKREDNKQLVILEEPHFAYRCLCYFVFLLFVGYGIWGVFLHGMSTPKSDVSGGTLLPRFFLFGGARFAGGREGVWLGEEITLNEEEN